MENTNLENFKVEELEQRLEMKKWGIGVSAGLDPDYHGNTEPLIRL